MKHYYFLYNHVTSNCSTVSTATDRQPKVVATATDHQPKVVTTATDFQPILMHYVHFAVSDLNSSYSQM